MGKLNKQTNKRLGSRYSKITKEMQCRFWEFNLNPITGWRVAKNHRKAAQLAERKYIKVLKPMPAYRSLVV